jgi:hypothetical protein
MKHFGTKTSLFPKQQFFFCFVVYFMILSVTRTKVALNGLFIGNRKIGKNVVGRGYGQIENCSTICVEKYMAIMNTFNQHSPVIWLRYEPGMSQTQS